MTQSEYASKTRCLQDLHQFSVERLDKTKEKIKPTNKNKIKESNDSLKKGQYSYVMVDKIKGSKIENAF